MEQGMPIPVKITVFVDKSFSFERKSPPASYFIKKAAKLNKGSSTPGRDSVATISLDQVKEIVEQKKDDLNAVDMDQACKIIAGTARSMGIMVEGV
jgi:large subunit ribosomal protein L11